MRKIFDIIFSVISVTLLAMLIVALCVDSALLFHIFIVAYIGMAGIYMTLKSFIFKIDGSLFVGAILLSVSLVTALYLFTSIPRQWLWPWWVMVPPVASALVGVLYRDKRLIDLSLYSVGVFVCCLFVPFGIMSAIWLFVTIPSWSLVYGMVQYIMYIRGVK